LERIVANPDHTVGDHYSCQTSTAVKGFRPDFSDTGRDAYPGQSVVSFKLSILDLCHSWLDVEHSVDYEISAVHVDILVVIIFIHSHSMLWVVRYAIPIKMIGITELELLRKELHFLVHFLTFLMSV